MHGEFVCLWSFEVRAESRGGFLASYGPEGAWVRLFRRGTGYIGSSLWEDRDRPGRYLTVDRWSSAEAYREFLIRFAGEYDELDRHCQSMTVREDPLGRYEEIGAAS